MLKRARLGGGGHWEWGTAPVCPACGQAYGGVEIEIEEGRIAGARTLPLAEIDRAEGAWTYDKRAGWVQRRDWEMGRGLPVKDGDPIEMVTEVDESEVDRKTGMVEARMMQEDGYGGVPRYAFLDAEFECPICHKRGRDIPAFWWGYVSDLRYDMANGTPATYHIGEAIRWRSSGGAVPAWTRFDDGLGLNAGDADVKDVLVMAGDPLVDGWVPHCVFCGNALGGFVIEVRAGIIVGGRYFLAGEFDPFSYDHYTFGPDGALVPHADLLNHPLAEVHGD
jgi:hypothetical protein